MALHEKPGATDEWYTPKYIFDAMDVHFSMDVASPGKRVTPWIPARHFLTANSLQTEWRGFLWMNAPFGGRNGLVPWLQKFAEHQGGICLVPDRTSAPWWQTYVKYMSAVLFIAPKVKFISPDGRPSSSPAQGTCLMAIGRMGVGALDRAAHAGLGTLMVRRV